MCVLSAKTTNILFERKGVCHSEIKGDKRPVIYPADDDNMYYYSKVFLIGSLNNI